MGERDWQVGEKITGEFLVREKDLREFRNKPGRYLSLLLGDESGEVEARVWEEAEALAGRFEVGEVVFIRGQVEEFGGRLQVKVTSLERAPTAALEKFIPSLSREQIDAFARKLKDFISSVGERHLRALLKKIFDEPQTWENFCRATAARSLHSAYVGGLLEHSVNVVLLCEAMCALYSQINRDLLITAALLHDIGKIDTFELRGAVFDYTEEGKLIGEPVLGERRLSAAIAELPEFPSEYGVLLSHLLLSHHGQREFGAPILPMSLEAVVLHHVDNLEAKTNLVVSIMRKEKDPAKVWSEYNRTLERSIYLPRLEVEEEAAGKESESE